VVSLLEPKQKQKLLTTENAEKCHQDRKEKRIGAAINRQAKKKAHPVKDCA
jgi:hypothetical protein